MARIWKTLGLWLVGQFFPVLAACAVGHFIGYTKGHEAGRIEMKCAIFRVVERLGDGEPAPASLMKGC